jgi:hypothetical protein
MEVVETKAGAGKGLVIFALFHPASLNIASYIQTLLSYIVRWPCARLRYQDRKAQRQTKDRDGSGYEHAKLATTLSARTAAEHGAFASSYGSALTWTLTTLVDSSRHGPISECALSVMDGWLSDYMNSSEGSRGRREIEQRYGKANVLKLVAKLKEDQANKAWLEACVTTSAAPRPFILGLWQRS